VRAGSKLVRYVRQVWLEDVLGVGFDTVKKVMVGGVEQVSDGRDVVAAVPEPFGALRYDDALDRLLVHWNIVL